jgi:secretion/DNA translocation related TadE-like protein
MSEWRRSERRSEAGSVTVLAAGMLLLGAVLTLAAVDLMRAVHGKARAQTAADAAALAAAQEIALPSGRSPDEVAADYAGRNGAMLVTCRCDPGTSEAVVEVAAPVDLLFVGADRTVRASARAVIEGVDTSDLGLTSRMAGDATTGDAGRDEKARERPP